MTEFVLSDCTFEPMGSKFVDTSGSYVPLVMQPERPRFNPYVIRRENRLLLCVQGSDQEPIRTFELDAVELTRLLVGAHEALKGYTLQVQEGV
jgi:hypothetical protein